MYRIKRFIKMLFTPITVLFIPHSISTKPLRIKLPSVGILAVIVAFITFTTYVFSTAVSSSEYKGMKETVGYYSGQFRLLKSTMSALKETEKEFKQLFSLNSKGTVLESYNSSDSGGIDMEALMVNVKNTVTTVADVRDFLSEQRNVYMATPMGWPVEGRVTSSFGKRIHPLTKKKDFHSGIDISSKAGTRIKATADGIVRYSGWAGGNGNLVVIEHGFGYTTSYAHNKKNLVKTGQIITRGDIVAYVGSTGNSTGPHSHYEIWKNKKSVNPRPFIEGRMW